MELGLNDELSVNSKDSSQRYINMYCDSQGGISLTQNPSNHTRTKHVDIHYHFSRDMVAKGEINLIYTPTDEQLADLMTKGLGSYKHTKFTAASGLIKLKQAK